MFRQTVLKYIPRSLLHLHNKLRKRSTASILITTMRVSKKNNLGTLFLFVIFVRTKCNFEFTFFYNFTIKSRKHAHYYKGNILICLNKFNILLYHAVNCINEYNYF